jgi:MerR family transcriptional regulator, heat shock protein HspR
MVTINDRFMKELPVYTIGVVSDLLNVHPETIRVWEKNGIVKPLRRSGKRFYSEADLKRLKFIQKLMSEELNLPAIRHYILRFYPCWKMDNCPPCMHRSQVALCTKPCWKENGTFCEVSGTESTCAECEFRKEHSVQKNEI